MSAGDTSPCLTKASIKMPPIFPAPSTASCMGMGLAAVDIGFPLSRESSGKMQAQQRHADDTGWRGKVVGLLPRVSLQGNGVDVTPANLSPWQNGAYGPNRLRPLRVASLKRL